MNRLVKVLLTVIMALSTIPARAGLDALIHTLTEGSKSVLHVILIDTTDSVNERDRTIYRQSIARELATVKGNDRVVVAPINGARLGEFVLQTDVTWQSSGRHFDDLASARKARQTVQDATETLLKRTAANATRLLDAFSALGPLTAQAHTKGMEVRLLVLSDMIEESETVNLARRIPDRQETARLLRQHAALGLIPDFTAVNIDMVGAAGADARASASIRQFWHDYMTQTHGNLHYYGRLAPM